MIKVSAAFVTHNHQILLFHRDNKPTIVDPDKWDSIGGHVEEGESFEEALKREIKEEIGVTISNYTFLLEGPGHWGEEMTWYHVQLTDSEAKSIRLGDEGQEIKFFGLAGFEKLISDHQLATNLYNLHESHPQLIQSLLN